ncbi:putative transporter MCH4 [Cytospora mali]|uniref:Transporter MCH4 n=1 Tax=Cytospora mali TaxID=578113 RepID=A0A194W3D4_CYTMA|nr:putative transporter MCH4 [Valsa mali]
MPLNANFSNNLNFPTWDLLPWDFFSRFDLPRGRHWCFLAEIQYCNGLRFLRYRTVVKDNNDSVMFVSFYLDSYEGFDWKSLKEGHTLAIMYAKEHSFLDMTHGVRVENMNDVHVFPVSLQGFQRLGAEVMEYSVEMEGDWWKCHGCHAVKPSNRMSRCAGCKLFAYCNKDCQVKGWKERDHKKYCKVARDPNFMALMKLDFSTKQSDLEKSKKPPASTGGRSPPLNGGVIAWLQVAGGFMLFFSTWGMINTFSVFQTSYESGELFKASSSDISWIGSIHCFLLELTGLVAGPIYDRGHLRLLIITGSFMVVFGLMMLCLCTEYWQVLLAQAFCVGIGADLLFTPTIGFPWAVRCIGLIALATFTIPLAVLRTRVRVTRPRPVVDWSAFRDVPFMVFTPSDRGFTDTSLAFYMERPSSTPGRPWDGSRPTHCPTASACSTPWRPITLLLGITVSSCMLGVRGAAGMIAEAVVTGFFSGVVVALPPVCCFRVLTEDKSVIGTRIGQGFAMGGVGLLIGGPSAGAV